MSDLTRDDVRKVADLAQLEFGEEELTQMGDHLRSILDYVEILNQVETDNVEPLAHPIEVQNVFRDDEPTAMLSREEALKNAPNTDGKYFLVPAILDGGE